MHRVQTIYKFRRAIMVNLSLEMKKKKAIYAKDKQFISSNEQLA